MLNDFNEIVSTQKHAEMQWENKSNHMHLFLFFHLTHNTREMLEHFPILPRFTFHLQVAPNHVVYWHNHATIESYQCTNI